MNIRNAIIYHCISCGHVAHAELEAQPPQCCGRAMAKAAEETIVELDIEDEQAGGHTESLPPTVSGRKRPR